MIQFFKAYYIVGEQFINPLANRVKVVTFTAKCIITRKFLKNIDVNVFLIFVYFTDQSLDDSVSSENNT